MGMQGMASLDISDSMRAGLRRLAKAVAVITSASDGARYAMAATAVSELSLDPPSLLICVNQAASLHAPLAKGANFCVNILRRSQEDIARLCSGSTKGEGRFARGEWNLSTLGMPFLHGAQAVFVCTNELSLTYGTHTVFIGRVVQSHVYGDVDPLIYADQRYGSLTPQAN